MFVSDDMRLKRFGKYQSVSKQVYQKMCFKMSFCQEMPLEKSHTVQIKWKFMPRNSKEILKKSKKMARNVNINENYS
jgi:hypothetical protein